MGTSQPEQSLMETLRESDLSGLCADYAELGLDAVLNEGLLRDIPVIGTIQKLYNVTLTLHNRLFMKKLVRFLSAMADVPKETRQQQISKLIVDEDERQRVGETLLLLLDRMNEMRKPEMMARVFKAFLEEKIDLEQLQALGHAIDILNMNHLSRLQRFYSGSFLGNRFGPRRPPTSGPFGHMTREDNSTLQALAVCGLVSIDWTPEKRRWADQTDKGSSTREELVGGEIDYGPTKLGRLFYDIVSEKR